MIKYVISRIFSENFEDEEKHAGKAIQLLCDQGQVPANTQPPNEDEVDSHLQDWRRTVSGPESPTLCQPSPMKRCIG